MTRSWSCATTIVVRRRDAMSFVPSRSMKYTGASGRVWYVTQFLRPAPMYVRWESALCGSTSFCASLSSVRISMRSCEYSAPCGKTSPNDPTNFDGPSSLCASRVERLCSRYPAVVCIEQ